MLSKEQANNVSRWVCEAEDAPSQHDEEKYSLWVPVGGGMLLQVREADSPKKIRSQSCLSLQAGSML